jgi:hypothetical protein
MTRPAHGSQHAIRFWTIVAVVALASVSPVARAQTSSDDCLTPSVVGSLLQERGGQPWVYAPGDRSGMQATKCATRRGARLTYRAADGTERTLEWVGTSQHGHWFRFRRVGTWFERYADRNEAKLPPVPAIYAALAPTDDETLMIVRLTPPMKRLDVPWTIEYQVYLKPTADPALPNVWTAATKGLDYRSPPRRAANAVEGTYAYNNAVMSPADAEAFHQRYAGAIMDFIEARFFDQAFPVSLVEVTVPGAGPVSVRAGVTARAPQSGVRPPEDVTTGALPDGPLFAFIHVMMGRALERDVPAVHRIRALRGGAAVYQFTSNPEAWKAGWNEYWLQHALPQGRFPAGSYTVEWQIGNATVALIPFTVGPR